MERPKLLIFCMVACFVHIVSVQANIFSPISKDTIKITENIFSPWHIVMGGKFRTGDNSFVQITSPVLTLNYNTVEGVHATYGFRFNRIWHGNKLVILGPDVRFSVPRNTVSGILHVGASMEKKMNRSGINVKGGRSIRQFNEDIAPFSNTVTTLLFQQNNLKLFEQDFINIQIEKNFQKRLRIGFDFEYAYRWELFNLPSLVAGLDKLTSNAPENISLDNNSFHKHPALLSSISFRYQPWLKYDEINGTQIPRRDSSPTFRFIYRKGLNEIFGSEVDFDNVTLGINHSTHLNINNTLDLDMETGFFLNNHQLFFMDFFHFPRNQAPFLLIDNEESFRLLPYYRFSTPDRFFKSNFNYKMSDFLLTRIAIFKIMGIKENFILNSLFTPNIDHYFEIGYGIDYILRIVRIEVLTSVLNGKFDGFGGRVGLVGNIGF